MEKDRCDISDEDLKTALKEIKTYLDITEEDLSKIYKIALRHARERFTAKVSAGEVMSRDVLSVQKEADLKEVARVLSERGISGLPVVDRENRVIGVVSERDVLSMIGITKGHTFKDILKHLLGEPLPQRKGGDTVEDVMSSPAVTVGQDTDIREVAAILEQKRIKRVPVVDPKGQLIGMVTRADILKVIGKV